MTDRTSVTARESVSVNLFKDGLTGGLQVSLDYDRGDGTGHGHRLLGPKFCGESRLIKSSTLTLQDVQSLRSYLRIAARLIKKSDRGILASAERRK